MARTLLFHAQGLGAMVVLNDLGDISGVGLYGPGFDGVFRVLELDSKGQLLMPEGKVSDTTWPVPGPYEYRHVGTGEFTVGADEKDAIFTFAIDRFALGASNPPVDFSPQPPQHITGTVSLKRLA